MAVRRLDRDAVRQLAGRAQLLDATRAATLVDLVDHLTPVAGLPDGRDRAERRPRRVEPARGESYQPADLIRALDEGRALLELRAFIRR